MKRDDLFIDGKLVDLDDNTKIALKFKSNIFTDIGKICSNHSYTIKLPSTVRNQSLMDHADLPAYRSSFTWSKHRARYFRNGVEIIPKGIASLMEINSCFEVSLVWGNATRIAGLVNSGETLKALKGNEYIVWTAAPTAYNSNKDIFIPRLDYGINLPSGDVGYHPVVRVSWILDRIQRDNGIVFYFPENIKPILKKLIVPLLEKNGGEPNSIDSEIDFQISGTNGMKLTFTINSDKRYIVCEEGKGLGNFVAQQKCKVTIIPNFKTNTPIFVVKNVGLTIGEILSTPEYAIDESVPNYRFYYKNPFSFEINEGDRFYIGVNSTSGAQIQYYNNSSCRSLLTACVPEIVKLGQYFPISANLPDIKQLDFIKAICAMTGLFAIPIENSDNEIKFVSIDEIYSNKSKARDWTKKVVASHRENKPYSMGFSLSDFAQNNLFKYKDDKKVNGDYSGNIQVFDTCIDKTKDMVTLPFAASDTNSEGYAIIPMYSFKRDDAGESTIEYSKCDPRILLEEVGSDGFFSFGVFKGLDFKTLINTYYQKYSVVVSRPKIIKEKIDLSDIELKRLDMTVPIYLAQYGRYYATVNITSEDTGICLCELLQLEEYGK